MRSRPHLLEADPARRLQGSALVADQVDEQAAGEDDRQAIGAQLGEAEGALHPSVGRDASVQTHVLCLVAEGVDVGARVFTRDQHAGRARSPLGAAGLMPAMEKVGVTGRLVRGVDGRRLVARLLEIEQTPVPESGH
jgi:hypothetical protein